MVGDLHFTSEILVDEQETPDAAAGSLQVPRALNVHQIVVVLRQPSNTLETHWWQTGKGWEGAVPLPGVSISRPAVSATTIPNYALNLRRVDVFGRGTDDTLQHWWWFRPGLGWHGPPDSLGGQITSAPTVTAWSPERRDVFARGVNGSLQHWSFDGRRWTGPTDRGGQFVDAPAAVSWSRNRIDVFARGTDDSLQHWWWGGNNWGIDSPTGQLSSEPAVASWSQGRLDVVAIGTDHRLVHWWWDGTQWSNPPDSPAGDPLSTAPAIVARAPNRLDVFAASAAGKHLQHWWWDGNTWRQEDLSRRVVGPAAVTSWDPQRVDVFAQGRGHRREPDMLLHWWGDP